MRHTLSHERSYLDFIQPSPSIMAVPWCDCREQGLPHFLFAGPFSSKLLYFPANLLQCERTTDLSNHQTGIWSRFALLGRTRRRQPQDMRKQFSRGSLVPASGASWPGCFVSSVLTLDHSPPSGGLSTSKVVWRIKERCRRGPDCCRHVLLLLLCREELGGDCLHLLPEACVPFRLSLTESRNF